ncbi:Cell wall-active antibiotics response 4TMS YvqF [Halogranum gelatinilyticum]|uniref:Cell wall-active antibiotics response 4TMS YvqF n=1 Tax=Halogranum gelatinilyticum TaxID=660521 RepID=A0A1G9QDL3_9EURY|nr:LiaF domain-containing protein [Halogranum gelatinilyticum]SDM09162.1 Cell wall-active antibiotics response 4TMS YvqF [Halogranum gelatinilyticum]
MAYRRLSNQSLVGVLIVLVGVVLLVDTTGLYDTGFLLTYVPSLFVLVGLYALVSSDFRNVGGPLVLVTVASAWQLVALDVVTVGRILRFWPLLIVLVGLSIALGRVRPSVAEVDDDRFDLVAAFGGLDRRATSKTFTGGNVTVAFGGGELDLRDTLVPAPPARVNVVALFGGVDVVVPRDWNVRLDVLPVFGAAEDDRPRREAEHDGVDLVVTGFCAFGGVTVTN